MVIKQRAFYLTGTRYLNCLLFYLHIGHLLYVVQFAFTALTWLGIRNSIWSVKKIDWRVPDQQVDQTKLFFRLGSASGVRGGATAEIEFNAFIALKSDI